MKSLKFYITFDDLQKYAVDMIADSEKNFVLVPVEAVVDDRFSCVEITALAIQSEEKIVEVANERVKLELHQANEF
jgi:hypothetical protein